MVVGNTDTTAFALDASDGSELWHRRLTSAANPITIAPTVANGTVYTSSTGQAPGGRGMVYALDLTTGRVKWRFDTIAEPWPFPQEASGGGAWYPPSVDSDGRVYVGLSNPYPWGGSRQHPNGGAYAGPALYTDTLVVLDGKSGKLLWYDQVTPHDVRDYDFQLSPILQEGTVIGAGKAGRVIAWSQSTHERLWQTPVGKHRNDLGPLPRKSVSVCPGLLGGVETPMAYADGRVFVPVVNLCFPESAYGSRGFSFYATDYSKGTGEFVALDASSGSRLWGRTLPLTRTSAARPSPATLSSRPPTTATSTGFRRATARPCCTPARAPASTAAPRSRVDTLLIGAGTDHPAFPSPVFELIAYALPGR